MPDIDRSHKPADVADLDAQRRARFTRQQVEDHLACELVHWLPGGEGGDTPEQRTSAARAAAKIIAQRLNAR